MKDYGEVSPIPNFITKFEFWLNATPSSLGMWTGQLMSRLVYGIVNSPYSAFMGRTIGGGYLNSQEQLEEFVMSVPGFVLGNKKGIVTQIKGNGLAGYNHFLKQVDPSIRKGTGWQKNISRYFQNNKQNNKAIDDGQNALKAIDVIDTVKD